MKSREARRVRHFIRRNKSAVIASQCAHWRGISAAALSSEQPPAGRLLASRNPFSSCHPERSEGSWQRRCPLQMDRCEDSSLSLRMTPFFSSAYEIKAERRTRRSLQGIFGSADGNGLLQKSHLQQPGLFLISAECSSPAAAPAASRQAHPDSIQTRRCRCRRTGRPPRSQRRRRLQDTSSAGACRPETRSGRRP